MFVASYAHMQTNVVTQDTGLASMLVSRGVYALSPRGKYYNDDEMNTVLFFRYVSAKERRSGRHTKGPKAFSEEDRQHFIQAFEKMLSKLAGI